MLLQVLCPILLISAAALPRGLALYFTQNQIEVTPRQLVKPNETLLILTATLDPDESGPIIYSINATELRCSNLDIDLKSGAIFLKPGKKYDQDIPSNGVRCQYTIRALLKGNPGMRGKRSSEMTLVVNKINDLPETMDCSARTSKELCFGDASNIVYSVMENSGELVVGYLGLSKKNCLGWKWNYTVQIDEDVMFVKESDGFPQFRLVVESRLNRESRDSFVFTIHCSLESDKHYTTESKVNGELVVLDQDDNPPMTQTGLQHQTVFISLRQPENTFTKDTQMFAKQGDKLLVVDKDTVDVNNFELLLLNDTKKILYLKKVVLPFTHSAPGALPVTFIYLRIFLSDKVEGMAKWQGLYCVTVRINDTTLVPGHGYSDMMFTLNVCLHWDDNDYENTTIEPQLSLPEVNSILNNGIFEGTFSRKTSTATPVLYAFRELIRDMSDITGNPSFQFTIENYQVLNQDQQDITSAYKNSALSDAGDLFEISPRMGIIYSKHPEKVKDKNIHRVILSIVSNITFGTNATIDNSLQDFRANVSIFIEGELDKKSSIECDQVSCAQFSEPEKCTSSCGFGSQGLCFWDQPMNNSIEGEEPENEILVRKYATCTPLPQTCPDTRCDEVEKMFPLLCPQDCAQEFTGFGHIKQHKNGLKYGIGAGLGVCSCHGSTSCSCGYLPAVLSTTHSTSSNESPVKTVQDPPNACDFNCILFLSAAGLLCLVSVGGVVYLWRIGALRRKKPIPVKRTLIQTGSHSDDTLTNNMLHSADYLGPEHGELVPMSFNPNFDSYVMFQVDSKWEIPRSELALEQLLGEGEFGRVMKGRVHDSDGYEKHSAVAVKMLKEHADNGKSSRQEFMAEFSLLKQVDHPNIVKLLGACTTPGGPPYLILEYAEFGSIRSFLRKCRRVENISSSHNLVEGEKDISLDEPLDFDPKKYVVSASEILGFSWQIAKGMVYLSDMKMVHRDLAARNILLTEDRVCKISDFGLTRDIYVDDAYRKKSKDRVPVKWLAPECLEDEFYTTKSDVWAYGVLLWELATLGASPYPGVQTEHLYSLLKSGYRMEQPQNCSLEMYGLMRQCWINEPKLRPSFRKLETSLAKLLEDGIEYLRLDIPTVSNPGYEYFNQSEDFRLKIQNTAI